MTNIAGMHHIALQAKDYKATIKFYEALGLTFFHSWPLPKFNIKYAALLRIPGTSSFIKIKGRRALKGETPVTGAL